jgi:hypothetical protein
MPAQPRILLTTLLALAPGACFDPMFDPGTGGGESDGSTSDAASTTEPDTSTTEPGSDTDSADSTGAVDAPPVITALTVDSSTMPPELQASGMVIFDVDATDDIGIDRIEIYDGDTLVTTVTEIPYRTELLLTSADNGSHSYSAVAYDTAGQTDESEVVPLSVNVVGGAMLELREDIGDIQVAVLGIGGPKLAMLPDDDLIVTGMARLESVPEIRTGLLARGYNEELSLLWSVDHAPPEGGAATEYFGFSAPSTSGQLVYVGGTAVLPMLANGLSVFALDPRNGALVDVQELWVSVGSASYVPVSADASGDVFATASAAEVARFSADFTIEHWRTSPLGDNVFELTSTAEGEALASFMGDGCAPGASFCLCKLSTEGDVLWTRAVAETNVGLPTRPTVSNNGHVAVASSLDDGNALLLVFDGQGNELANITLDTDTELYPLSITYGPSDDLVVVGGSNQLDTSTAWAMRVRENQEVLWEQAYEIGASDSMISGVISSPSGRLYVSGHADPFDIDFLTHGAHAWVAELAL